MKTKSKLISLFGAGLLLASVQAPALTLDQYLEQVQKKNKTFQSLEASQEAAETRYDQGDLELSPVLFGGVNYLDDKARTFSGAGTLTRNQTRQSNLGLSKKFSTGTKATLQGTFQSSNFEGTLGGASNFAADYRTSTLGLTLSQSLWKDFFGKSTNLRHQREASQKQLEKSSYDLQAQQALIRAESIFWDLMYLQQELQIRKDSLDRARKIESWVRRRAANGIGDRADILNSQGLVATRELQLLTTQDELKAAEKNFADQIEWTSNEPVPQLEGTLEQVRPADSLVRGGSGKIMRFDSYLSVLEAQAKKVSSEEATESVRPDVVLQGTYKTNGYGDTDSETVAKMTDPNFPTTSVGLQFTWLVDWDTKNSVRKTAHADALAAQLKKERQMLESETAWSEFQRRHSEMTAKIKAAQTLSEVQSSKAAAERDKLSKGRSITSNVILAEQDAAEAQLTLTKLKAEQRKLESQGRFFVKVQEGT